MPRLQFNIATLFFVITTVAILCFVARLERIFPYWTVLPGCLFVAGCFVARRHKSPDLVWGLFGIAWLVALMDVVKRLILCFAFISGPPSASEMQHALARVYISTLAFPCFLALPATYFAVVASRGARSYGRKWIIACLILGFVDVTVLTVWPVIVIEHTWPW